MVSWWSTSHGSSNPHLWGECSHQFCYCTKSHWTLEWGLLSGHCGGLTSKYFSYCWKCALTLSIFKYIYLCILTPDLKLYQPFALTDENTVSWLGYGLVITPYHPNSWAYVVVFSIRPPFGTDIPALIPLITASHVIPRQQNGKYPPTYRVLSKEKP